MSSTAHASQHAAWYALPKHCTMLKCIMYQINTTNMSKAIFFSFRQFSSFLCRMCVGCDFFFDFLHCTHTHGTQLCYAKTIFVYGGWKNSCIRFSDERMNEWQTKQRSNSDLSIFTNLYTQHRHTTHTTHTTRMLYAFSMSGIRHQYTPDAPFLAHKHRNRTCARGEYGMAMANHCACRCCLILPFRLKWNGFFFKFV